jgi:hypothetical protein
MKFSPTVTPDSSSLASVDCDQVLLAAAAAFAWHIAAARHFRIPFCYGLLFPLAHTVGAFMALDSVRRRLPCRVSWKGRFYS